MARMGECVAVGGERERENDYDVGVREREHYVRCKRGTDLKSFLSQFCLKSLSFVNCEEKFCS